MSILQTDLKYCVSETLTQRKISAQQAAILNQYIDKLSIEPYKEVSYLLFNKELSQGLTFKDYAREAIFSISSPAIVGNIAEEKKFSSGGTLSTTYNTISLVNVYNKQRTTLYVEAVDYTINTETGVITRVISGNITAESIVHIDYFSEEAITIDTAVLETTQFSIPSGYIKSIKIDATNENVQYQLSINNSDFFDIQSYNIYEKIKNTDNLKLRVITEAPNVIKGVTLIVNTNMEQ